MLAALICHQSLPQGPRQTDMGSGPYVHFGALCLRQLGEQLRGGPPGQRPGGLRIVGIDTWHPEIGGDSDFLRGGPRGTRGQSLFEYPSVGGLTSHNPHVRPSRHLCESRSHGVHSPHVALSVPQLQPQEVVSRAETRHSCFPSQIMEGAEGRVPRFVGELEPRGKARFQGRRDDRCHTGHPLIRRLVRNVEPRIGI